MCSPTRCTVSHSGGVRLLLQLKQTHGFVGFSSLATLLIRHTIEDPNTLQYTMEKALRVVTSTGYSSTTKEFHYLMRMMAPAVCRDRYIFPQIAQNILRVDHTLLNKGGESSDPRLLMKCVSSRSSPPCTGRCSEAGGM